MRTFQDRVAVVTGAAGGIGRATALALARRGCEVAVADIDADGLAETVDQLEAVGGKVSRHDVDVADKARMQRFADEVVAAHGRVHVLVNNAGVSVTAPFSEQSLEDFEWIVGINFWGVVYGCKFFLPHLQREPEGHIVNLSSMFGFIGLPTQISYCATKFAVRGFSEALHAELHGTGIGVTSVHPGGIKTSIVARARGLSDEDRVAQMKQFERFGRDPAVVASAILRGIEKRKLRVIVTPEAYLTEWLKRIFPVTTSRLVSRLARTGDAARS